MLDRFAMGATSRVSKALAALVDDSVLVRDGTVHGFDDPFLRAWVIEAVLPDVGLTLPITHLPG